MEHLALEIFDLATTENPKPTGSKYATLPEDASITITDTSEIFESGDVWSYDFTLNVHANAHIFGTAGDIHGSRLHEQINKRRARLWVEGLPLYLGYLKLDDEVDVDEDGNVDVIFESGQKTFDEMIEGAKANQVPMMSEIEIGMALWRKRHTRYSVGLEAYANADGKYPLHGVVRKNGYEKFVISNNLVDSDNYTQKYPRMVFPKGEFVTSERPSTTVSVDCLNTDYPYDDEHPYCNVALCYQKYGYEKKDENGSITPNYSSEPEAQRGYEYMSASRVNSAPNFFVLYWLRCLMKHLGIFVEENQMLDVEDLRRLFFVNTNCSYYEAEELSKTNRYGKYIHENDKIIPEYLNSSDMVNKEKSGFAGININYSSVIRPFPDLGDKITVKISEVNSFDDIDKEVYLGNNRYFHKAFATSDCFPNVDVSEVVSAIENGFGVRFLFSDNYQRVRIVLLRNIFHSQEVQNIACDIIGEPTKIENNIRGFRMTYGDNDDTHFYYKGFADMLPHKKEIWVNNTDTHDYSHWNLNAEYAKLINKVSAFDKTCYVTPNTGNAYGIKIDKDAKRYDELHPALFGYADFMDAEDGDCTGDKETVMTIETGFMPAIMNDLNMEAERGDSDKTPVAKQRFALFVDETMRPRRFDFEDGTNYNEPDAVYDVDKLYEIKKFYDIAGHEDGEEYVHKGIMSGGIVKPGEFAITSDMYVEMSGLTADLYFNDHILYASVFFDIKGHLNEGYRLYLQDNYEPNDDGVSPIETHDWGLTLGIMRGSGSDAYIEYKDDPDDEEDNQAWDKMPGSSVTAHPDTCDDYGNMWNYDIETGRREVATYLQNAGWSVTAASDGMASCTYHYLIDGIDFLCTPIKYIRPNARPDGEPVLTKAKLEEYVAALWNQYGWAFADYDFWKIILSAKNVSGNTAYADGRFSLKLRAEKPNPYFDSTQEENDTTNRRYLEITNKNLQGRGLADQFYKEYSYWIRNARIVNLPVKIELAQLLAIDKTKRVTVGDITGFIKKMHYTVSNKNGLGVVNMEIMYI